MEKKAFAFSMDAAIAVILVVSIILLSQQTAFERQSTFLNQKQLADDVFVSLDNTGYLVNEIDTAPTLQDAANNIYATSIPWVTPGYGESIVIKEYVLNTNSCRANQSFTQCFGSAPANSVAAGGGVPTDRSVVSGRKIFAKRSSLGVCALGPALLSGIQPNEWKSIDPWSNAFDYLNSLLVGIGKSKNNPLFFAGVSTIVVDANASLYPQGTPLVNGGTVSCDQDIKVDLNAWFPTVGRGPINMIFSADKSNSMGECGIVKGNVIDSNSGTTNAIGTYVQIHSFAQTDNNAFDLLFDWGSACASNCPDFYVQSPTGTLYGAGQAGTTQINTKNCREADTPASKAYYLSKASYDYLAIGDSYANSKSGTWKVFARGNTTARSYTLKIKKINSEHFNDSTQLIEGWYQPIAKIEIAQTIMEDFRFQPGWKPQIDEYAYEEIGKDNSSASTGTKLRPSSGLRPINDNALAGFLAGLDTFSAGESAFGYALSGNNLINDKMSGQPPIQLRIAVFIGDGDSNGTPTAYNGAVAAKNVNVKVYTIGIGKDFNFTDLKTIANVTGGTFYNAADQNALDDILDLIAQDIGVHAATLPIQIAPDVNIFIPIAPGSIVHTISSTQQGTYQLTSTQLAFYIKDLNDLLPWYGSYQINYPCNTNITCDDTNHNIPELGSVFNYIDVNGFAHLNLDFNAIASVTLRFRDLNVEFVNATFIDINHVNVTVGVRNVGYLTTVVNPTDVNLYLNDPSGPQSLWIGKTKIQGPLCGMLDPTCVSPLKSFDSNDTELFQEGTIYARIDENLARDCPRGNKRYITCVSNPAANFYSVEYYVWKK